MAELSRRSQVPVATIKYYLREGLLPQGNPTAATRAEYHQAHLRRLRLIRALVETGEIPVAGIRHILAVMDDQPVSPHDLFGAVQYSHGRQPGRPSRDSGWQAAAREVDEMIAGLGWTITADAPARALLVSALAALRSTGARLGPSLHAYASAMATLAASEVAAVAPAPDGKSQMEFAEGAVVAMVLYERVLIAMRRLAYENASARFRDGCGNSVGKARQRDASDWCHGCVALLDNPASLVSECALIHDRSAARSLLTSALASPSWPYRQTAISASSVCRCSSTAS
ncbi:MAG TPA: MerR family transcriptional regulator [Streptosporangiaceae bacterium]